ncbi:hypothetical protein HDU77_006679 [Chytriomyces hyalinus]|nr:hypothetical protein HDU77_006679 [Chytriomyces hyalinus]
MSKHARNLVHMDTADLLSLKIKEQSQMLSILERELSTTRDALKHKERQLDDYKVESAKALAKAIHDGREASAKCLSESSIENSRIKGVVRELELALFKERLRSKQLEENQRRLVTQCSTTRQEDVGLVVRDLNELRRSISKSLIERLKT